VANPTQATIRRLFALSGNFCAYPGCSRHVADQATGAILAEICHIHAKNPGGPRYDASQSDKARNDYDNLILLCADHHKIIDTQPENYPAETLKGMKQAHEHSFGRPEQAGDGDIAKMLLQVYAKNFSVGRFTGDINVTGAESVTIKSSTRKVIVGPAPGTIGADQKLVRYIEHLIKRYNEYASKDPFMTRKFSHGAIRRNIEHNFGASWQKLSSDKSDAVIDYLQGRIDKTSIAKKNRANGDPAYSTYVEFNAKHP
jgi:hypothetical protein